MLLFIDVETSGLLRRDLPPDDPGQPWVISLAAELCDVDGNQLAIINTAIRANGRTISEGARAVHGVSSRDAGHTGISELAALAVLCGRESFVSQATHLIGHNIDFDVGVIEGVLLRCGREASALRRPGLQTACTMKAATPFCKIAPAKPRDDGSYKWPSMNECRTMLLGKPANDGLHGALQDMLDAKELYFWLRERGAFEVVA